MVGSLLLLRTGKLVNTLFAFTLVGGSLLLQTLFNFAKPYFLKQHFIRCKTSAFTLMGGSLLLWCKTGKLIKAQQHPHMTRLFIVQSGYKIQIHGIFFYLPMFCKVVFSHFSHSLRSNNYFYQVHYMLDRNRHIDDCISWDWKELKE